MTVIEGLSECISLKNLDISHNKIGKTKDCEQLKELPALTSLDMRNNIIDDHNNIVPFFQEMKQLIALYLKGNPAARLVSNYRRVLTIAMPTLYYLDERPIFEHERLLADAFALGGKDEEERVRVEWAEKQKTKTKTNTEFGVKLSEQSK